MKYFFFIYAIVIVLVIGIFGFRGEKFAAPPFELFPDMDHQDKLKAQKPTQFFVDGMGSRQPVPGTVPQGHEEAILPLEFTAGLQSYYATGVVNGTYGNGMPTEIGGASPGKTEFLINRGREMFNVHCAICHGESGNGAGVVSKYLSDANVIVANLDNFGPKSHPDGYIFHVISNGKGNMGGYKHNIPLQDRWAITAYLRVLQTAK